MGEELCVPALSDVIKTRWQHFLNKKSAAAIFSWGWWCSEVRGSVLGLSHHESLGVFGLKVQHVVHQSSSGAELARD